MTKKCPVCNEFDVEGYAFLCELCADELEDFLLEMQGSTLMNVDAHVALQKTIVAVAKLARQHEERRSIAKREELANVFAGEVILRSLSAGTQRTPVQG